MSNNSFLLAITADNACCSELPNGRFHQFVMIVNFEAGNSNPMPTFLGRVVVYCLLPIIWDIPEARASLRELVALQLLCTRYAPQSQSRNTSAMQGQRRADVGHQVLAGTSTTDKGSLLKCEVCNLKHDTFSTPLATLETALETRSKR